MRNQESEIGFLGATAGLPSSALYHLFERALVSGVLQRPLPGDESPGYFLTPLQRYGLSRKKRESRGTPMSQSVITFENRFKPGEPLFPGINTTSRAWRTAPSWAVRNRVEASWAARNSVEAASWAARNKGEARACTWKCSSQAACTS